MPLGSDRLFVDCNLEVFLQVIHDFFVSLSYTFVLLYTYKNEYLSGSLFVVDYTSNIESICTLFWKLLVEKKIKKYKNTYKKVCYF